MIRNFINRVRERSTTTIEYEDHDLASQYRLNINNRSFSAPNMRFSGKNDKIETIKKIQHDRQVLFISRNRENSIIDFIIWWVYQDIIISTPKNEQYIWTEAKYGKLVNEVIWAQFELHPFVNYILLTFFNPKVELLFKSLAKNQENILEILQGLKNFLDKLPRELILLKYIMNGHFPCGENERFESYIKSLIQRHIGSFYYHEDDKVKIINHLTQEILIKHKFLFMLITSDDIASKICSSLYADKLDIKLIIEKIFNKCEVVRLKDNCYNSQYVINVLRDVLNHFDIQNDFYKIEFILLQYASYYINNNYLSEASKWRLESEKYNFNTFKEQLNEYIKTIDQKLKLTKDIEIYYIKEEIKNLNIDLTLENIALELGFEGTPSTQLQNILVECEKELARYQPQLK